jgi:hypothetical protein
VFLRLPFFGAMPGERLVAVGFGFTGLLPGLPSFHTSLFRFLPPFPPRIDISAVRATY